MIIFFRNIFFYIKNIEKLIIKTNISQPITGLLGGGMHRNDRIIIYLGLVLVVIAVFGAAVSGSPKAPEEDVEPELDITDWPIVTSSVRHITGEVLAENSYETITISDINESYMTEVFFELHWEDEDNIKDAGYYKVENQPDYFNFTVVSPWDQAYLSETGASTHGGSGIIEMNIPVPEDDEVLGDWTVTIHCGDCGDQVVVGEIIGEGPTVEEDTGNGWALTYYYTFRTNN